MRQPRDRTGRSSVPDYQGYVIVLGEALDQIARESIAERRGGGPFDQGYLMGLHRAVTLMQQTAEQFEIPPNDLGVAGVDEAEFTVHR